MPEFFMSKIKIVLVVRLVLWYNNLGTSQNQGFWMFSRTLKHILGFALRLSPHIALCAM